MGPVPEPERSDEELALLAARRPESAEGRQAAGLVLGRWARQVYRWCCAYVRDSDLSEDLAQDVLLRAYSHLSEFEGWGRFSAWLFIISRNVCLDAVRRQARNRQDDVPVELIPDSRRGPDAALDGDEWDLWELLRRHLTPQEEEALRLRCFEMMPVDLITELLGIEGKSGARAVLQSARRKLRRALGERLPSLREGDSDDD